LSRHSLGDGGPVRRSPEGRRRMPQNEEENWGCFRTTGSGVRPCDELRAGSSCA
jgi:hypothetical protein